MRRKLWRTWRDDFVRPTIGKFGKPCGFTVRFPPAHGFPSRYFGMVRWGSVREALRQARLHRDELCKLSGEPRQRRGKQRKPPFIVTLRRDNSSGIVGVTTDGEDWNASWHPRIGKAVRRSFAIRKYGYEKALAMAVACRKRMIARMR